MPSGISTKLKFQKKKLYHFLNDRDGAFAKKNKQNERKQKKVKMDFGDFYLRKCRKL